MHIRLKDLISERAAEFTNNSVASHVVDLSKEKEESKLLKGEFDTDKMPPGSFHESVPGRAIDNTVDLDSQRQVGKYHYVNYSSSSRRDIAGTITDPFMSHGAGNEFYGVLKTYGSGG